MPYALFLTRSAERTRRVPYVLFLTPSAERTRRVPYAFGRHGHSMRNERHTACACYGSSLPTRFLSRRDFWQWTDRGQTGVRLAFYTFPGRRQGDMPQDGQFRVLTTGRWLCALVHYAGLCPDAAWLFLKSKTPCVVVLCQT